MACQRLPFLSATRNQPLHTSKNNSTTEAFLNKYIGIQDTHCNNKQRNLNKYSSGMIFQIQLCCTLLCKGGGMAQCLKCSLGKLNSLVPCLAMNFLCDFGQIAYILCSSSVEQGKQFSPTSPGQGGALGSYSGQIHIIIILILHIRIKLDSYNQGEKCLPDKCFNLHF